MSPTTTILTSLSLGRCIWQPEPCGGAGLVMLDQCCFRCVIWSILRCAIFVRFYESAMDMVISANCIPSRRRNISRGFGHAEPGREFARSRAQSLATHNAFGRPTFDLLPRDCSLVPRPNPGAIPIGDQDDASHGWVRETVSNRSIVGS